MFQAVVELLPIFFAVATIVVTSINFNNLTLCYKDGRVIGLLSIVSAFLLIFAQSSWFVTVVVHGSTHDAYFSKYVWTVYNLLVMYLIILINKK
jgi:hypothetical protein